MRKLQSLAVAVATMLIVTDTAELRPCHAASALDAAGQRGRGVFLQEDGRRDSIVIDAAGVHARSAVASAEARGDDSLAGEMVADDGWDAAMLELLDVLVQCQHSDDPLRCEAAAQASYAPQARHGSAGERLVPLPDPWPDATDESDRRWPPAHRLLGGASVLLFSVEESMYNSAASARCRRCALTADWNGGSRSVATLNYDQDPHNAQVPDLAAVVFDPHRGLRRYGALPEALAFGTPYRAAFGAPNDLFRTAVRDAAYSAASCAGGSVHSTPVFIVHELAHPGHYLAYVVPALFGAHMKAYGEVRTDSVLVLGGHKWAELRSSGYGAEMVAVSLMDNHDAAMLRLFTDRPIISARALAHRVAKGGDVCFADLHVGVDASLNLNSHTWATMPFYIDPLDGSVGQALARQYHAYREFLWSRLGLSGRPQVAASNPAHVLFVNRATRFKRQLRNADELMHIAAGVQQRSVAKTPGVAVVGTTEPETETMRETAAAFHAADIIVMMRGSSSSHLQWTRPGSVQIVVSGAGWCSFSPVCVNQGRALGIHSVVICEDGDVHYGLPPPNALGEVQPGVFDDAGQQADQIGPREFYFAGSPLFGREFLHGNVACTACDVTVPPGVFERAMQLALQLRGRVTGAAAEVHVLRGGLHDDAMLRENLVAPPLARCWDGTLPIGTPPALRAEVRDVQLSEDGRLTLHVRIVAFGMSPAEAFDYVGDSGVALCGQTVAAGALPLCHNLTGTWKVDVAGVGTADAVLVGHLWLQTPRESISGSEVYVPLPRSAEEVRKWRHVASLGEGARAAYESAVAAGDRQACWRSCYVASVDAHPSISTPAVGASPLVVDLSSGVGALQRDVASYCRGSGLGVQHCAEVTGKVTSALSQFSWAGNNSA